VHERFDSDELARTAVPETAHGGLPAHVLVVPGQALKQVR
jgi:hypothetical protein